MRTSANDWVQGCKLAPQAGIHAASNVPGSGFGLNVRNIMARNAAVTGLSQLKFLIKRTGRLGDQVGFCRRKSTGRRIRGNGAVKGCLINADDQFSGSEN